jgi:multimeric flavodoxin WrbA
MRAKKILPVMGSPRKKGSSATLAKHVIAGTEARGREVQSFYFHRRAPAINNHGPCLTQLG